MNYETEQIQRVINSNKETEHFKLIVKGNNAQTNHLNLNVEQVKEIIKIFNL